MEILEYLESFNRKERFHLIGQLLGNADFRLAPIVLTKILSIVNLEPPLHYFSAMDYHIDWIYASLYLALNDRETAIERDRSCISATQEDVDFLVAFLDDAGVTHIIMIEAKGDTSFTNAQLLSKAERFRAIFGQDGTRWQNVQPHFLVCSPMKSKRLELDKLPSFMVNSETGELNWFRLYMPINQRKVTQCDRGGKPAQGGDFWKVDNLRMLPS